MNKKKLTRKQKIGFLVPMVKRNTLKRFKGIIFNNPNAKVTCGCGESFSI